MFAAGEQVIREIGWFYMNARSDHLPPGQLMEAIRVHPADGTPYADAHILDSYWMVAGFLHFPKE